MISSTANSKVKRLVALVQKAKLRREEQLFVVEGIRMFREAPAEWIREVYVSESFLQKCEQENDRELIERLKKYQYEVFTDEVFKKVSDTQTPQGVLCVLAMPHYDLAKIVNANVAGNANYVGDAIGNANAVAYDNVIGNIDAIDNVNTAGNANAVGSKDCMNRCLADSQKAPLLVLLEDLQDPGNLGTILRAGEGAGVDGVVMTSRTVDIMNPKVIRATMGSIYRVPFFTVEDLGETINFLIKKGVQVYAAHLDESVDYDEPDYTKPTAFLIGNEGGGLRRETAQRASQYIKIPMAGQVESLNAAAAATVLMYEAARQRRKR